MRVKAQVSMVLNLDKCIGCHTCSVTCKTTWTNRPGTEYIWFNNVETRPGVGYPARWEDQKTRRGGWELKHGKLQLKAGSKAKKLVSIFANPDMPEIDDYYEPWTYDYETLTDAPEGGVQPVARARSVLTGKVQDPKWGPNWDDDLAAGHITGPRDPNVEAMEEQIRFEYEQAFMVYLPRLCEHCLNPSCVASCPSGALYKRDEDGIVLVDQDTCRAWRFCVSGCPYKKVYFNWHTQKAEKCHFCYPRIETGQPTICSETCVGRLRYIGMVLYDADRVQEAASVEDPKQLLEAQRSLFLDPRDPEVIRRARADGIPDNVLEAAARSPIWKLAMEWQVALPLHPEFRTLPMVWYIPPLSPLSSRFGENAEGVRDTDLFAAVDAMRVPIAYLANMLSAGDEEVIRRVLRALWAMRIYMRSTQFEDAPRTDVLEQVNMSAAEMEAMYRLLAIAKYDERYVIPQSHRETAQNAFGQQGGCGFDAAGRPAMGSRAIPLAVQQAGGGRQ